MFREFGERLHVRILKVVHRLEASPTLAFRILTAFAARIDKLLELTEIELLFAVRRRLALRLRE